MHSNKERLYYKVEIDGRKSPNVLVRSIRRMNNTYAASFLIKSLHEDGKYSITYLSQIDLIEVMSLLSEQARTLLWSDLTAIYLEQCDTVYKTVKFMRDAINNESGNTLLALNGDAVIINPPEEDFPIKTSFGFDLSYRDFCDCLSLMLSMEPRDKLKIVLSKYFILSELLAGRQTSVDPPVELANCGSAADLREAYDGISLKIEEREIYDTSNFNTARYSSCFQNNT